MPTRYFTPAEANDLLAKLRPLAERMVEHRRTLGEARRKQTELVLRTAGNGRLAPGQLAAVHERAEAEAAGVAACVEAIKKLGVLVKDLDRGLLDFPARRGAEDVLLCWQVGEDEVAYWHGLEEGFAGRRPLPL